MAGTGNGEAMDEQARQGDPGADEDVVALLVRQHGRIHTLFDEVRAAEGAERHEPFRRLMHLLAVHETAEEEVVHPHARSAFDGGSDVVRERLAEEKAAKEKLAALEELDVRDPTFMPTLLSLRDAVLAHARAEERYEFALLRRTTSPTRLALMAAAVRAAEATAPTRPHPGVESATANLTLAPPLTAVVDRARDAVRSALRDAEGP
ncbi:hemerythrin domain-containing protein [Streptomyces antimicrobicus]|uniref:Hemerythrin domain-containing protein n=1 Tax=Streptomyces antimicrobicus TaxID=2883108 RepID=A0ABS8B7Z8_9ACTN|nr:hemerythrin domain-containing protein [Streptomyces antimicrobicus]MCB5180730.1 hemerythrin domain-containing protein [Streptomyces antimicrobicus]